MSNVTKELHRQVVRGLVMRKVVCPLSGKLLDHRTCGVVLDVDGDPVDVYHPDIHDRVRALLKGRGVTCEVAPYHQNGGAR